MEDISVLTSEQFNALPPLLTWFEGTDWHLVFGNPENPDHIRQCEDAWKAYYVAHPEESA